MVFHRQFTEPISSVDILELYRVYTSGHQHCGVSQVGAQMLWR